MVERNGARPNVTIHYAQTLDGRIATHTGHSRWISCDASLRLAHRLRAEHDAVLVGAGTIVADDPHLTVRHVPGDSPRRVVVDSTLRLPLDAHVLTDRAAPTLIATTSRAPAERADAVRSLGAEVLVTGQDANGRVDLEDLLQILAQRGIASVLLEGGSALITSALNRHLVDRLVVCIAPKLIGTGIQAVGDLHIRHMDEALMFERTGFTVLEEDIIFEGRLARDPEVGV